MLDYEADRDDARTTLIFFLTDGLPTVGETSIEGILRDLGEGGARRAHIFSVGVGYDVNTHLLSRLAEAFGGAVEYVTPDESVELKVGRLIEKTSRPLLSDLRLTLDGVRASELYPDKVPFLFQGDQISVVGRFDPRGARALDARIEARRPDGRALRVNAASPSRTLRAAISWPACGPRARWPSCSTRSACTGRHATGSSVWSRWPGSSAS